jgi:hypothetical protein
MLVKRVQLLEGEELKEFADMVREQVAN